MIVVAGKNEIAIHGLNLALAFFSLDKIIAVINSTDDGNDGWQPSYLKYAREKGVAVKTLEEVYQIDVDVFLSLEFDKLVNVNRLKAKKAYNIHFSSLPRYKGMYTSIWPVLFADAQSGVTLHIMDSGIDTGDILSQRVFSLTPQDRAQDCYRKYLYSSKILLDENFKYIANGFPFAPLRQAAQHATYYSKSTIDFKNLEIDFNKCAWQVERQIYAFSFRVYQFLSFQGREVVNIRILDTHSIEKPGSIVVRGARSVTVSTIDYDVELVFDGLDQFLIDIPNINLVDLPERIFSIAGVNDRNDKGWSPIIVAAYHGRTDIVRFLIENGADVNDVNYKGTTVLMYAKDYALKTRDRRLIDFLLSSGADKNLKDHKGNNVFDYINDIDAKFLGLINE